jgi:transposase-like protein
MPTTYSEVLTSIRQLPNELLIRVKELVTELLSLEEKTAHRPSCPNCQSPQVRKHGVESRNQRYFCRDCHKTFSETKGTLRAHSRFGRRAWEILISDTIDGISLDKTASKIGTYHQTAFTMRHKFLLALVDLVESGTLLKGTSELDETYVLENQKGTKLPADFGRGPRKHGAKASKRGLSNEQICLCTGISREGAAYAKAVNRAKPSREEIAQVFVPHLSSKSYLLCDGLSSYRVLENQGCTVHFLLGGKAEDKVHHINTVNGFHSFIQSRLVAYRGVATKYLNRYGALFSLIYGAVKKSAEELQELLFKTGSQRSFTQIDTWSLQLLMI